LSVAGVNRCGCRIGLVLEVGGFSSSGGGRSSSLGERWKGRGHKK